MAAALYSLGLVHAILTLVRRREHVFRLALGALSLGTVFHLVSIVEEGLHNGRVPIANFYETLSMCAFLVGVLFLFVHWRYQGGRSQRVYLPAGFCDGAGGYSRQSGERLVEPDRSRRLADDPYRAGASGIRRAGIHRGGLAALPLSGA